MGPYCFPLIIECCMLSIEHSCSFDHPEFSILNTQCSTFNESGFGFLINLINQFAELSLQKKPMSITIGQKAPDFTLYNTEKKPVSLSDFAGKKNVLLLFFPLAFTSTCTKELCDVRDDIGTYENEHTQVLGISVDSTYTLAKYKEEQHYNYPLLSDFNKTASTIYDTVYESFGSMAMQGVSKRSAFIIDKQGVVKYAEVLENASNVPDFRAIREVLERLSI